jgi:small GTP-binding protein
MASSQLTITGNSRTIRLNVFDTAGQERYRSLLQNYCREAAAGFLVFSVDSHQSFEEVDQYLEGTRTALRGFRLYVVGNKVDLAREVSPAEGELLRARIGAVQYYETSAATGEGVDLLFRALADDEDLPLGPAHPPPTPPNRESNDSDSCDC